jgi:hypothetical protein
MFVIGQLVWVLASDESGNVMPNHAPVLIIAKYTGVPRAFIYNDEANEQVVGTEEKIIYDILCDGIVEFGVDEDWLGILSDDDIVKYMSQLSD